MKLPFFFFLFLAIALGATGQTYNYYYGNLHSHTGFSDGNQDSLTSGVSRPDGSYAYANLSQNFDFLGISEHNHFSSANNPGFQIQSYSLGLSMANTANQDGSFLALFGMEYGVSSNYNGHVVIYGFTQLLGWETGNFNIYNGKTDYDALFKKVKNNPNAFCYLAHPYSTDFTTNGTAATALGNAPYNATYDSAIVGVPLRSGPAFSTITDYTDFSSGSYFNYFTNLLSKGYHIGIGYDHDNHNTNFGRSVEGRLVILAPALTRPDLTTAMQKMHFYGSDDWNAKIAFTLNGNIMGSVLTDSVNPSISIVHNDPDGEQVNYIKLWRGVAGSNTLPTVISVFSQNNTATYAETNIVPGPEYYYFAEILQNDGDLIVTSPIWYKIPASTNVSIAENQLLEFTTFPNPVSGDLNVSFAEIENYSIVITDISGRIVLQEAVYDRQYKKNLLFLNKGVYVLTIKSKAASATKKLVIEN